MSSTTMTISMIDRPMVINNCLGSEVDCLKSHLRSTSMITDPYIIPARRIPYIYYKGLQTNPGISSFPGEFVVCTIIKVQLMSPYR